MNNNKHNRRNTFNRRDKAESMKEVKAAYDKVTQRTLEFIGPMIEDISGSTTNRITHAALLSAMTVWTANLEAAMKKATASASPTSNTKLVDDFVNDAISRASNMASNSIMKLVETFSPTQAAQVASTMAASADISNSSFNNRLKGIYAASPNTKYNDPHAIKVSDEFRDKFDVELDNVGRFVQHEMDNMMTISTTTKDITTDIEGDPTLLYFAFVYAIQFLQNYLRVIDGFNDYDIKFCLAMSEMYLNNIKNIDNKDFKTKKQIHSFSKDQDKKDLI